MSPQKTDPDIQDKSPFAFPQPLGVHAGPPGCLLLPYTQGDRADRADQIEKAAALISGKVEPLPPDWEFYTLAVAGRSDEALACLKNLRQSQNSKNSPDNSGDDPLIDFDIFVLAPSQEAYSLLAKKLSGYYLALLQTAGYLHGLRETPLDDDLQSLLDDQLSSAKSEKNSSKVDLLAFLLSTRAHFQISSGKIETGLNDLIRAGQLAKPVFAARILGELGTIYGELQNKKAIDYFEKSVDILDDTDFQELRAEMALELGICCQSLAGGDRSQLLKAINAYQQSLRYFHKDGPQPYNYGLAHMNLALAYLAMPMNDEAERLRPAIAVQSLREALKVFTRDEQPMMWASVSLNLANALQHVPSAHNEENLWEAVALYQEILEIRQEDQVDISKEQALAYARVLANQGNALAHLGAFKKAQPILEKALTIFAVHDADSATTVQELLDEIAAGRSEVGNI